MRGEKSPLHAQGFTLLELLVVIAVLGIAFTIAALELTSLNNPLQNAARQLSTTLLQTRTRALSTTSAYRLLLMGDTWTVQRAKRCSDTEWKNDSSIRLELPRGVNVAGVSSSTPLCFNSRGIPNQAYTATLQSNRGSVTVEVMLGGSIRRSIQ